MDLLEIQFQLLQSMLIGLLIASFNVALKWLHCRLGRDAILAQATLLRLNFPPTHTFFQGSLYPWLITRVAPPPVSSVLGSGSPPLHVLG